jgi:hypothetical protein
MRIGRSPSQLGAPTQIPMVRPTQSTGGWKAPADRAQQRTSVSGPLILQNIQPRVVIGDVHQPVRVNVHVVVLTPTGRGRGSTIVSGGGGIK